MDPKTDACGTLRDLLNSGIARGCRCTWGGGQLRQGSGDSGDHSVWADFPQVRTGRVLHPEPRLCTGAETEPVWARPGAAVSLG